MTWHNVADGSIPNNSEVVEVQLANGSVQLALFSGEHWRTPAGKKALPQSEPREKAPMTGAYVYRSVCEQADVLARATEALAITPAYA